MAKVSLNKIITIKTGEIKTVSINDQEIQIKQYLPFEEKIEMVEKILNQSIDELNDFNFAKLTIFTALELIKAYTNISFTETQLKDVTKLYDLLDLNNVINLVRKNIPEQELDTIDRMIKIETNRIRTYFHSLVGMLSTIQQDYATTNMDVDNLINKLQTGENFELVKDILTKVN